MRSKSRAVTEFDARLHKLLDDLWETMNHADGVGLAAPQVGILKRVAVIHAGDVKLELINPSVTEAQGGAISAEACLSVPDRKENISRPQHVTLRFQDRNGKGCTVKVSGLAARAACHEIDHMDGILYYDRL